MATDDPASVSPGRSPEAAPADAQTVELLEGFVEAIRRGQPTEEAFHRVMEALFAVGERLHASAPVDPALRATLTGLRKLELEEVLPPGVPKGRRVGKRREAPVGAVPLERVERWLDTIRSTLASLQGGKAPHASLIAYCRYVTDHGPGPSVAWFIPLAIRAVEDEHIVGATSQADALARLGATEALPALRRAVQRDYRDPKVLAGPAGPLKQWAIRTEENFDAEVKRSLRQAIAALEGRPAASPPAADPGKPPAPASPPPAGEAGGLTPADLRRVEETLGRPLSPAVREFYRHYPAALRAVTRDLGPTPDGQPYLECAADNELTDNVDGILALNDRRSGHASDWPDNMLVVGEGGCGETYWVDLDDEGGAVHLFDAGSQPEDSARVADSLAEFARQLLEAYRDA